MCLILHVSLISLQQAGLAWSHSKAEVQAQTGTIKQGNKKQHVESLKPDLRAGTHCFCCIYWLKTITGSGRVETTESQDREGG